MFSYFLSFLGCTDSTNQVITYDNKVSVTERESEENVSCPSEDFTSSELLNNKIINSLTDDELIDLSNEELSNEDKFIIEFFYSKSNSIEYTPFDFTFEKKHLSELKKTINNDIISKISPNSLSFSPYPLTTFGTIKIKKVFFKKSDSKESDSKYHTYMLSNAKNNFLIVCFDDGENMVQYCPGTFDKYLKCFFVNKIGLT
jgi:hypothetical protein